MLAGKRILVFDTETDGLIQKKLPLSDPNQAWPVSIAAKLMNDKGEVFSHFYLIVRCPTVINPESKSTKVHGITEEIATAFGVKPITAISMFLALLRYADVVVGHNIQYDIDVVVSAMLRIGMKESNSIFLGKEMICTADKSRDVIKMPPTEAMLAYNITEHKTPNLGEAYNHFTGEFIPNAHNAMADVDAAALVLFKLFEGGHLNV